MSNKQPSQADRIASHILVGLIVGAIVGRKAGVVGFFIAALLSAVAHELLDAPVASALAEIT